MMWKPSQVKSLPVGIAKLDTGIWASVRHVLVMLERLKLVDRGDWAVGSNQMKFFSKCFYFFFLASFNEGLCEQGPCSFVTRVVHFYYRFIVQAHATWCN